MAWAYCLNAARRVESPSSYSLGSGTGQTLAHSPQLVHLAGSMKRGRSRTLALKRPGPPSSDSTSAWVMISMLRCRPTSTSLGEMIHIAQSLVGKVLSNWDIIPPMADCFSTK